MDQPTSMAAAIAWGQFVEVAYQMYASDKINPPTPANFPAGWERVANLTMTPRLELIHEREFAGFIAQSATDPMQQIVAIRGTESGMDWMSDFEFILETFHEVPGSGKTEQGFTNLYRSMLVEYADPDSSKPLQQSLLAQIDTLPAGTKLVVTGHSLGSSLATLHAFVAASKGVQTELVTFASPRVGDKAFVEAFQALNMNQTRVYNEPDIVPKMPIELAGYRHIEPGLSINSTLFPLKHSITCYHALSTYLYVMGDEQADICKCSKPSA
ncbi:lipase family protein [Paenibacillus sp. MMS18-CY102]|uniref:lipase family protein n=1 Tax=Paenibacillus sp. MMS18-CY102 TaxID=2682849 RepID=UPI001922E059|nr:lipase family protein [Paenibacillus sp. MMS18-CY102]